MKYIDSYEEEDRNENLSFLLGESDLYNSTGLDNQLLNGGVIQEQSISLHGEREAAMITILLWSNIRPTDYEFNEGVCIRFIN
jgi:hypothetical protein